MLFKYAGGSFLNDPDVISDKDLSTESKLCAKLALLNWTILQLFVIGKLGLFDDFDPGNSGSAQLSGEVKKLQDVENMIELLMRFKTKAESQQNK